MDKKKHSSQHDMGNDEYWTDKVIESYDGRMSFITFDLDALDPSIIAVYRNTGAGGLFYL